MDLLKRSIAECIGTLILVFVGCGTGCMLGGDLLGIAAAFGLAVTVDKFFRFEFINFFDGSSFGNFGNCAGGTAIDHFFTFRMSKNGINNIIGSAKNFPIKLKALIKF